MERQWFPVSGPSGWVIGVTGILAALFLWFAYWTIGALAAGRTPAQSDAGLTILLGGVFLWRLTMGVRGYRLGQRDDGSPILWIERLLPVRRRGVPLARLRRVAVEPALPPILNTNLLGLGGVFGWTGPAMIRGLGNVDIYGLDPRRAVILEFTPAPGQQSLVTDKPGPIYIVTPADPTGFAAALNGLATGGKRRTASFAVADLPGTGAQPAAKSGAAGRRKRR